MEELYRKYRDRLVSLGRGFGWRREDTEDLVQTVFLHMLARGTVIRSWSGLVVALVRAKLDERPQELLLDDLGIGIGAAAPEPDGLLEDALARMQPREAEILRDYLLEGLDTREVAAKYYLSSGGRLSALLRRLLAQLAELMEPERIAAVSRLKERIQPVDHAESAVVDKPDGVQLSRDVPRSANGVNDGSGGMQALLGGLGHMVNEEDGSPGK